MRCLPDLPPEHDSAHGGGYLVDAEPPFTGQLWRPLFLADLQQLFAILGAGLGALRLGDRRAAHRLRGLRRQWKDDLHEVHQAVLRTGGTARAAIEDEHQIRARPSADRPRQFTRPPLGYPFAEFGAQLLGTHPADVATDSSRRGLRELLRHRGEPGTLPHLLGEPLGEPPYFVLLLRVVYSEKDFGDAPLRFVRGFLCALHRS